MKNDTKATEDERLCPFPCSCGGDGNHASVATENIVSRLRAEADCWRERDYPNERALMFGAAAEIERLRAELKAASTGGEADCDHENTDEYRKRCVMCVDCGALIEMVD